jgi:hypothetical protein
MSLINKRSLTAPTEEARIDTMALHDTPQSSAAIVKWQFIALLIVGFAATIEFASLLTMPSSAAATSTTVIDARNGMFSRSLVLRDIAMRICTRIDRSYNAKIQQALADSGGNAGITAFSTGVGYLPSTGAHVGGAGGRTGSSRLPFSGSNAGAAQTFGDFSGETASDAPSLPAVMSSNGVSRH